MQRSKTPSGAPLTNILGPDPIRLGFLGVQKVDIDLRSLENSKVNSFFHLASISFLKNVKNIHYYFLGEKNQYFILPTTSQEPKPILNSKTTTVSTNFFCSLTFYLNAQNFLYKGYIYSNGTPLVGASVYINSLAEGVTSNQNGFFLISTDIIPSKLSISYVGYKTKTIIISINESLFI